MGTLHFEDPIIIDTDSTDRVLFARVCAVCVRYTVFALDADKLNRWEGGEFVQNVWPEQPASVREQLISGTHPECWDRVFGGDRSWEGEEEE